MDAFLGEIRAVCFNFPPYGWASCNGALLPPSQYAALFAVLGTTYGGNGSTSFALPNLQAVTPLGAGAGTGLTPRNMGDTGGAPGVDLTLTQIPAHTHLPAANSTTGGQTTPNANVFGSVPGGGREAGLAVYASTLGTTPAALSPVALASSGGSTAHNNLSPYLALNYIICLEGQFPVRS
jgi:microcystin-dependent protein